MKNILIYIEIKAKCLCVMCVFAFRFVFGAAAEWRGFTDRSVQLVQALRRPLLPTVPCLKAAALGSGRVWPPVSSGRGGGGARWGRAGEAG